MILLSASNLWRGFDEGPVLRGVRLQIRPQERIGLVGPNGVGKTTLLRILAGLDEPDQGTVELHSKASVGLLQQERRLPPGRTLLEEARLALQPLLNLQAEALAAAEALSQSVEAPERQRLERRYDRLQQELEHREAFQIDHRVDEVLAGLGLGRAMYEQPVETLSGGQVSRLLLARLLLQAPHVMLLDEPSNHLDLDATAWLEDYLLRQKQAWVVVSHDRYLLDRVTTRTLELFEGQVADYSGNFSAYWQQQRQRSEVQRRTHEKQQEFIAAQEAFIRRYHYGQRHAQAKDRQKKIERLERVEKPREIEAPPMGFRPARQTGEIVLQVNDLTKGFERPLFQALSFQLLAGERLGIVGPNGCGKTTLLRVLLGELPPDFGTVRQGANLVMGYFDQQLSSLARDEITLRAAWPARDPSMTEEKMRGVLARFGLSGDVVYQRVDSLSGGQKSRLTLARLAACGANLLVLDEPTNHLDLWACASLEESLCAFEGAVLFVSHDRYFLNQVAQRLLVFDQDRVRWIPGNFDTYLSLRAVHAAGQQAEATHDAARDGSPSLVATKTSARKTQRTDAKRPARSRRFPYRKAEELEEEIAQQEAALKLMEETMGKPETYESPARVRQVRQQYESLREQLETLYEHWEEAMERG